MHKTANQAVYRGHFLRLNHGEQFHVLPDTPYPAHNINQTTAQTAADVFLHTENF